MAVNFVTFSNWTRQSHRKKKKLSKALIKAKVFPLCLQKTDMKISPIVTCSLFHTILIIYGLPISVISAIHWLMENVWDFLEADLTKLPCNDQGHNDDHFCIKLIVDCVHVLQKTLCSVESCNKRFKILNKYSVIVQTSGLE